jgi:AcrR family transcriptional regulator
VLTTEIKPERRSSVNIEGTAVTNEKRRYRMSKRAEAEEETRRRITQSTVVLHEELGPSRTSVSAIAAHAGVRRSTLYRHFPDELALFTACTAHWMAANPPPDPAPWATIADADERLRMALDELYPYYRRTQSMMENIHRDEEVMPLVKQMMGGYRGYIESARDLLMESRQLAPRPRRYVEAAIGHALSFPAWRSLALKQGLSDEECADLMCRFVRSAGSSQDD